MRNLKIIRYLVPLVIFCISTSARSQTNQWTWIGGSNSANQAAVYGTQGIASPTNIPGGRPYDATWIDPSGYLWILGINASYVSREMWKWDGNQWIWISSNPGTKGVYGTKGMASPSNIPGQRYGFLSWVDKNKNLWLFGGVGYDGSNNQGYLNDLWKWDGTNWAWMSGSSTGGQNAICGTQGMPSPANVPGARSYGTSWTAANGHGWAATIP